MSTQWLIKKNGFWYQLFRNLGKNEGVELLSETPENQIERLKADLLMMAEAIAEGTAGKIHAIRCYRSATDASLLDAKNWVERIIPTSSRMNQLEHRIQVLEIRGRVWRDQEIRGAGS